MAQHVLEYVMKWSIIDCFRRNILTYIIARKGSLDEEGTDYETAMVSLLRPVVFANFNVSFSSTIYH